MLNKGYKIGQYELLNQVGSGGFGDVWKAEKRTALDVNYFALKFFRPKDDRIDFDKIGKELAVWKRLKGLPHIISVIELDRFDDYVYVVSDFADGGSLENWLKDNGGKASSEAEAVKITLEILTGLENLHDKGFVHRDLKPDNILIMNDKFCLADFGVSREIKTHSKATGTAGTMEYMPPEAFAKTPSITPQTDIWAVGVILQRLLTGALPYPQEDYPSLVSAILMYEPEPMPESVSECLREIVKKALQKESGNRFKSARAMHEALKNPEQFLAEVNKKKKNSDTIIDEDFDKTEQFIIEPTKDWSEIEAEKQAQIEQERLKKEKVETDKAASTAKSSSGESFRNSIGMEFVRIPAGSFMMGSPTSEKGRIDNETQHRVTISKDFYLGKYEVTQAQWQAVMGSNPSYFKGDNLPVENVSWDDAQEFTKKLNAKNEETYRLPTEAEWEYAARGGKDGEVFGIGDGKNLSSEQANFNGNYPYGNAAKGKYLEKTVNVGSYQHNNFGLYDMHGNVWEWVQDIYNANYRTLPTDSSANLSIGDSDLRVLRGGSWGSSGNNCRSANRNRNAPASRNNFNGFRVVARARSLPYL